MYWLTPTLTQDTHHTIGSLPEAKLKFSGSSLLLSTMTSVTILELVPFFNLLAEGFSIVFTYGMISFSNILRHVFYHNLWPTFVGWRENLDLCWINQSPVAHILAMRLETNVCIMVHPCQQVSVYSPRSVLSVRETRLLSALHIEDV